jgi:hypothetical protein
MWMCAYSHGAQGKPCPEAAEKLTGAMEETQLKQFTKYDGNNFVPD